MEADIKPLVAPSSPAYPWLGKQHSYWGRIRLWVSQAAEGTIDSRIIPVVLRHLQQEAHDVELEGIDVPALRAQLADHIRSSQQPPPALVEAVNKIQQQVSQQHQAHQSSDYKQWLEEATSGGMKGLYSAIRKPETTTVRPYRDLPLEVRPHARRAAWMSLWQPTVNEEPSLVPALTSLQLQAIRQSRLVGPVSALALRKVVKKLSTKAPGLDGLTSRLPRPSSRSCRNKWLTGNGRDPCLGPSSLRQWLCCRKSRTGKDRQGLRLLGTAFGREPGGGSMKSGLLNTPTPPLGTGLAKACPRSISHSPD